MNRDLVERNWKHFMGKLKAWWGNLSGDPHNMIAGQRVELTPTTREPFVDPTAEVAPQGKRFDVRKQIRRSYISS